MTVAEWGDRWMTEREATGYRNVPDDRRRWQKHIATHAIAHLELSSVDEREAREWFHSMLVARKRAGRLAANTCRNALNLIRASFSDACEAGLVDINPFRGLKIPRARLARSDDPWTVLMPNEQESLLQSIDAPTDNRLVAFAIGSGLAQGEQWSLRRKHVHVDVDAPHVEVALAGVDDRPVLRPRIVPLFGAALLAVRSQLTVIARRPNTHVWPDGSGEVRQRRVPRAWRQWLSQARIRRRVVWKDLRHTCAAALVSGWWGRTWSLEEVKELLGHSSITITERYAHFAKNVLTDAAREMTAKLAQPKGLLP